MIGPLVTHHLAEMHPVETAKPPKLPLPRIGEKVTSKRWEMFLSEWQSFSTSNNLQHHGLKSINSYLLHACDPNLKASVWKQDPKIEEKQTADVLEIIKNLAVHRVAKNVAASELFAAKQERDESGVAFAARLRGMVQLCGFVKKCSCNPQVDVNFEDIIVLKVFLSGLFDEKVREDVLGMDVADGKTLDETVKLVEAREVSSRSSSYRNEAGGLREGRGGTKNDPRLKEKKKCKTCREMFAFNVVFNGKIKAFDICKTCHLKDKAEKAEKQGGKQQEAGGFGQEPFAFFSGFQQSPEAEDADQIGSFRQKSFSEAVKGGGNSEIKLNNFVFDHSNGWVERPNDPHPLMRIKLEVDPEDWKMRGLSDPRCKQIEESNEADTGAMGDLIGLSQAQKMGFNESNMVGVNTRFNGINGSPVDITGAVFLKVLAMDDAEREVFTKAMFYVSHPQRKCGCRSLLYET